MLILPYSVSTLLYEVKYPVIAYLFDISLWNPQESSKSVDLKSVLNHIDHLSIYDVAEHVIFCFEELAAFPKLRLPTILKLHDCFLMLSPPVIHGSIMLFFPFTILLPQFGHLGFLIQKLLRSLVVIGFQDLVSVISVFLHLFNLI